MAFKKPGRPALPDSQRRKNRIRVHFSNLEMQYLNRMAGEGGLVEGGIPGYIRKQALGRKIHAIPAINREAWVSLARLSANLNQIAHLLHLLEDGAAEVILPDIRDIQGALGRLRGQLLGEGFFPPPEDTESHITCENALIKPE